MPELPEVETTLLGIKPYVLHQTIQSISVRQYRLRWPIPSNIQDILANKTIIELTRRGKYMLLHTDQGALLIHLGMSGRLCVLNHEHPPGKHDHVDIYFTHQMILRYTDPRRFGAILWVDKEHITTHPLLSKLGIEPFDDAFTGLYLWQRAQRKTLPIKSFIMDHHIVVGVGNIYATEALFLAGIHPTTPTGKITLSQLSQLTDIIRTLLHQAILQGGTTLKDFLSSDGKPGYFSNHLHVYGRSGLPCLQCQHILEKCIIGQRTSTFCARCQKV